MASIAEILEEVVMVEGGYVNHPDDKGGPTIWGITERVARKHGYLGDMRKMTREQAKTIYLAAHVHEPGFNLVHAVSPAIARELIDTGVNMGTAHPCIWLQESLNAFNDKGSLYPDIKVDGDIGPATASALRAYLTKRGKLAEKVMLRALNSLQGARYISITEAREQNESFTFGWFANRVEVD